MDSVTEYGLGTWGVWQGTANRREVHAYESCWLPSVVGEWIDTDILEHDHGATPTHDAEAGIVDRFLKGDFKPKPVAIERECSRRASCTMKNGEMPAMSGGVMFTSSGRLPLNPSASPV